MAQDTAHTTQHTERAYRFTGAKWPRGRTRNTTNHAGAPVNTSQVAQDNADAKQRTERAHR